MPSYRVAFIDLLVQTRVSDASIRLPTASDVPCRLSCRPTPFYAILRWLLDRELLIGRAYPVSHCSLRVIRRRLKMDGSNEVLSFDISNACCVVVDRRRTASSRVALSNTSVSPFLLCSCQIVESPCHAALPPQTKRHVARIRCVDRGNGDVPPRDAL